MRIEERCDDVDTRRVADKNDSVGELFGLKVKVEYGAVRVDDELG